MNMNLNILHMAQAMASNASQRQTVIANNIANADTPGFKARDVVPFVETYAQSTDFMPRTTRPRHQISSTNSHPDTRLVLSPGEAAPNGNSVSIEMEMTKAVELRHQYDMALGIYRKSIDILRTSLGR